MSRDAGPRFSLCHIGGDSAPGALCVHAGETTSIRNMQQLSVRWQAPGTNRKVIITSLSLESPKGALLCNRIMARHGWYYGGFGVGAVLGFWIVAVLSGLARVDASVARCGGPSTGTF